VTKKKQQGKEGSSNTFDKCGRILRRKLKKKYKGEEQHLFTSEKQIGNLVAKKMFKIEEDLEGERGLFC